MAPWDPQGQLLSYPRISHMGMQAVPTVPGPPPPSVTPCGGCTRCLSLLASVPLLMEAGDAYSLQALVPPQGPPGALPGFVSASRDGEQVQVPVEETPCAPM